MRQQVKLIFIGATASLLSLFQATKIMGQCPAPLIKLEHTSGTTSFDCSDVTVTSIGGVDAVIALPCYFGPYWIGRYNPGSYVFTFSPPAQGVTLNMQMLDNWPGFAIEEVAIDVNGAFYPLSSPGTPPGCQPPAILMPNGTLRGPIDGVGGTRDLYIPGPIYTLKVTDNFILGDPLGIVFEIFFCCYDCNTDAGTINANDFEACIGGPAVLAPSTQFSLEPDDLLQYILFSDASSPKTSIIATSNSPSFNFNPATMTVDIPYYIAAIAGNGLNGNVDITDPCLDISNMVQLIWRPEPTVAFASAYDCFQPGECYDLTLNFEGTPPFQISGQALSGNNIVATFGGVFSFNTDLTVFCLSSSTPDGPVTIKAISLSDAHCSCD